MEIEDDIMNYIEEKLSQLETNEEELDVLQTLLHLISDKIGTY